MRTVEGERGCGPGGLPMRMAVIAMGRLGGRELGYGSDADVLFVHEPYAPDGSSRCRPIRWRQRPPTRSPRRCAGCSRCPGPDPPLVIDAGLRPEGKHGPLTRSLASYAAYYERWSLGWEAQALLRARPIVGDQDVGLRFAALADEIRYPAVAVARGGVGGAAAARPDGTRTGPARGRPVPASQARAGWSDRCRVGGSAAAAALRRRRCRACARRATLPVLAAAADAGLLSAEEEETLRTAWSSVVQRAQRRRADDRPRRPTCCRRAGGR